MEDMKELLIIAPFASAIISILIQVLKSVIGDNGKKFIPVFAVIVGILSSLLVNYGRALGLNVMQSIVAGIILGGTAVGFYEFTKLRK